MTSNQNAVDYLLRYDPEIAKLLSDEEAKQKSTIGLIASENIASPLSVCLEGCVFTNKNIEGYPGKRYSNATENMDAVELLAIDRLKNLFHCEYANIQSANATIANTAVFLALVNPGDTVLSMGLSAGGHLSHGAGFHFSGKFYNIIQYEVKKEDERIDMEQVFQLARTHHPKLIICGSSSYSRLIDYEAFRKIADEIHAILWVDAAHIIGLIAGGAIPSPVPYADVVTFSTQKTLRGPRGCGVILCKNNLGKSIDRGVFPSIQGGGKGDMLAARAVLFKECMSNQYKEYQKQVLKNAKALCNGCVSEGLQVVSGGTDNHMLVLKVKDLVGSGKIAEDLLEEVGIIVSKNLIPFDTLSSFHTSGIRIGSPLMTTRGAKEDLMYRIGQLIGKTLHSKGDASALSLIAGETSEITARLPMFSDEWLPSPVCN